MRVYVTTIFGLVLVAAAVVGIVWDRIHWAGIPSMAFAGFWQDPQMIGSLSVVAVAVGFLGMLLLGVGIGGYSASRRFRQNTSEEHELVGSRSAAATGKRG